MAETGPHPFGHQSSAIDVRAVLIVGAILAVTVLVAVTILYFVMDDWVAPRHAQVNARPAPIPPAPRLQPHPRNDLADLRAQKRMLLSSYAWADGTHRYARIPIDRAMQIYAQQHATTSAPAAIVAPLQPATPAPIPKPMAPKKETAIPSSLAPASSTQEPPR